MIEGTGVGRAELWANGPGPWDHGHQEQLALSLVLASGTEFKMSQFTQTLRHQDLGYSITSMSLPETETQVHK